MVTASELTSDLWYGDLLWRRVLISATIFVADILVAAEMGECRIATQHPAGMRVQHAAAGAAVDVVFDFVQPIHRTPQLCLPSI